MGTTSQDGGFATTLDLNADVGEVEDPALLEVALLEVVTSANIATGAHAGNPVVMNAAAYASALRLGVRVGAHPSYRDRAGFGRRATGTSPDELRSELLAQIGALDSIARSHGSRVHHVKPHGALYHRAVADEDCARLLARVVRNFSRECLSSPPRERHCSTRIGLGSARSPRPLSTADTARTDLSSTRGERGDLLTDPDEAAEQAVSIATSHRVRATDGTWIAVTAATLCLHGDTPGAPAIALAVRAALESAGVRLEAPA